MRTGGVERPGRAGWSPGRTGEKEDFEVLGVAEELIYRRDRRTSSRGGLSLPVHPAVIAVLALFVLLLPALVLPGAPAYAGTPIYDSEQEARLQDMREDRKSVV